MAHTRAAAAGVQLGGGRTPCVPLVADGAGPTSAMTPVRSRTVTFSVRTDSSKRSLRALSDTATVAEIEFSTCGVVGSTPL